MRTYTATAKNFSTHTENRIHSDDVAATYGFQGALVPGVAVFGHMTRPLVASLGVDWLTHYRAEVRLLKPAYHGDELTIHHSHEAENDQHVVRCHARGLLLAELTSRRDGPSADSPALPDPGPSTSERPEIHWRNITVGQPFPSWTWTPDAVTNAEACAQVGDDLAYYREGVVHPHAILATANRAFTRRYLLPAWLHVGSVIHFRRLLREGDAVEVRTMPTRKWQRKGHEFVDLEIAYLLAGEVATAVRHTSIFKIANRT